MLSRQGIIAESEARAIVSGLEQVLDEIEKGEFHFDIGDEDIHMAVEKRLTEIAGPVGGKLHTARTAFSSPSFFMILLAPPSNNVVV